MLARQASNSNAPLHVRTAILEDGEQAGGFWKECRAVHIQICRLCQVSSLRSLSHFSSRISSLGA